MKFADIVKQTKKPVKESPCLTTAVEGSDLVGGNHNARQLPKLFHITSTIALLMVLYTGGANTGVNFKNELVLQRSLM